MDNQQLTKREEYILRKQQKEQEHFYQMRNRKIKKIIAISLPSLLIIGGVIFAIINYSSGENNQGTAKIEINPLEYDAGTVTMADNPVKYTFEIKNTGDGDLKINRIWTSCMCTTARLKVGDKESEEFGMHSNPVLWSQKIVPGEIGFLEVTFDQAFHGPQGTGLATRIIYISSNVSKNKKAEAKLTANVVQ